MLYEKEWENPNYKFLSYDIDNLNWHIHYHESFEICYVLSGEIDISINNEMYSLCTGESVMIFPRQLHSYKTAHRSRIRVITFMPELIPEFTNRYANMIPKNNRIEGLSALEDFFYAESIFEQKGLLYTVLGILLKSTHMTESQTGENTNMLLDILRYIEKNFKSECLLQTAATELSYGYSYLSRTFKKSMGMSYTEYLNKYRINRAVYLLSSNDHMQIQQVAEECGYESLCSFNRNFKLFMGCSPSEMQKAHRRKLQII